MARLRCPECGGELEVVEDGVVSVPIIRQGTFTIGERLERATFVACGACEYCETVASLLARALEAKSKLEKAGRS